jgi:hypothetical protein
LNKALTDYERSLAERFRSDLFDQDQSWGDESIIDPANPLYGQVLAIAFPPFRRQKRKRKNQLAATQERMKLDA